MARGVRKSALGGQAREQVQSAATAFEAEVTQVGVQSLVTGVAPITPADRLAMRANAPLLPRRAQRPADHGLFDMISRTQIEMF